MEKINVAIMIFIIIIVGILIGFFIGRSSDIAPPPPPPTPPPPQTVITLDATKIICNTVECLPRWGGNQNVPAMITEELILQFLEDNPDCYVDENWEFQYSFYPSNPGDNVEYGGEGWITFTGKTTIDLETMPEVNRIGLREVVKTGYLPFAGDTTDPGEGSAEFYAHTDAFKYDNFEYISTSDFVAGNTYYIVGFNVPLE